MNYFRMKNRNIKNKEKSLRSRLFNLARQEQLNYQMLIIRYAQERLLYRLSQSKYRERFYLKGGVLLYAFEQEKARPTFDIDFTGNKINREISHIRSVFTDICGLDDENDGIHFNQDEIQAVEINENRVYVGVRLIITARMDTIKQPISVDVGFGDAVVPEAKELEYPLLLPDLPAVRILAYSPETIIAEKFQAMIELAEANSRMKDFYDVYRILKSGNYTAENLQNAITATFKQRLTRFSETHSLFSQSFAKDSEKQQYWSAFLRKNVTDETEIPPRFEETLRYITDTLYPYWKNTEDE